MIFIITILKILHITTLRNVHLSRNQDFIKIGWSQT